MFGLDAPDVEKVFGKGNPSNANRNYVAYRDGAYSVTYDYYDRQTFSGPRRATKISRSWGPGAVTIDAARAESKTLIPADAQFMRTFIAAAGGNKGMTVDIYRSEWLKGQIPAPLWEFNRTMPGTFAVVYNLNLERTINSRNGQPFDATMVIGLGEDPSK